MPKYYNGNIGNNVKTAKKDWGFWQKWESWFMYGGGGSDTLTGGPLHDRLYGDLSQNGSLSSVQGNDVLKGLDGNDLIYGHGGNDNLYGNNGRDVLYGGSGRDNLYGGSDNDSLFGESGNDRLFGHAGNDYVNGGTDADYISGGSGNDTLVGGSGNDTLVGGSGDDLLIGVDASVGSPGRGEKDTLISGSYKDSDRFVLGQNGKVFYDGGGFSDYAVITDFDKQSFFGETAFDTIQLAGGYGYRLGAVGKDTYIYKDNTFGTDDLIGVVQNVQGLSLTNSDHFVYG